MLNTTVCAVSVARSLSVTTSQELEGPFHCWAVFLQIVVPVSVTAAGVADAALAGPADGEAREFSARTSKSYARPLASPPTVYLVVDAPLPVIPIHGPQPLSLPSLRRYSQPVIPAS